MAKATVQAIPQTIKEDLIGLALMESQARGTRIVIRDFRRRLERRMPGASRLARNLKLVERLVLEHNARAEKMAAKANQS